MRNLVLRGLGVAAGVAGVIAFAPSRAQGQTGAEPQSKSTPIDSKVFSVWSWRNLGPLRGGRSVAAAGSASRPLEYYFGATGGGIWKTVDGGSNWAPVSDAFLHSASVGSLAVCEANPDVVYAGMGEGDWRTQMSTGDGAYASRDGGRTWTHIGLASSSGQTTIPRIKVDPKNCDVVYAGVFGDPYGPNPERGVFRSTDGGRSWTKVLYRGDGVGAIDLVMDPADPKVLYATLWDAVRPPWGGRTGLRSGIFKTTDGGDTWSELTRNPGLPKGRIGKVAVAVPGGQAAAGGGSRRVYLDIETNPDSGGVFRSDDGGATWTRANGNTALTHRAEYYTRMFADTKNPDRIYILGRNVYRSDDAGQTFTTVRTPHGDDHDLWIAPDDPNRMIEANDGGANVTFTGGRTWSGQAYSTGQIYHVITTPGFPYLVCGAQQDNTSKCLPSDGEGSFWYQGPAGEQGYIALDPRRPTLGWGGSQRGELSKYDRATGQRQQVTVWPSMSDGEVPKQLRERFQWTFPVIMDPSAPDVLYVGSQHVWKTTNGGHSWQRISPDLTRADPRTLNGSDQPVNDHSGSDYYATVFTIAVSPKDGKVIWTGSDDGLVHVTRDGGATWEKVTPPGLPEFTKMSLISASPFEAGKAYIAAERYKLADIGVYIYKTADYGKTWTKITEGIPSGSWARSVKEDPKRAGLLYAGTEHGIYVSFDDGVRWQSLSLNLPDVQVADLEVHDNDLVIATFGRGIYILDDISPLRELGAEALAQKSHLFKPGDAIRTASGTIDGGEYRRTLLPGANRVNLFYTLSQPAQKVTLEILDARGQVVRRYVGTPDSKPRAPIRNSVGHVINMPVWGSSTPDPVVKVTAGLNRVAWDLRLAPATDFPGLRLRDTNTDGPVVPPGEYRARLTVDGESQEQTFRVSKDPRLADVSQADLEAQFAFARIAHSRLNDATSAVVKIRELKAEIDDRMQKTSQPKVRTSGTALKGKLGAVEGEIYEVRVEAESDIKHWGPKLTNKLGNVYAVAKSADAPPTEQVQAVFAELSPKLEVQLQRLNELLKTDVVAFNDLLRSAKLPPIGQTLVTSN